MDSLIHEIAWLLSARYLVMARSLCGPKSNSKGVREPQGSSRYSVFGPSFNVYRASSSRAATLSAAFSSS